MSQFKTMMVVAPMPDGVQWALQAPLVYESDLGGEYTVPAGFVTDLASIPKVLWAILPPWSRYGPAAVVHDWLYWSGVPRATCDGVLREAMILLGVDQATVNQIYGAVSAFGQAAWDRNAELRKSGYTRMAGTGSQPPYAQIPDLPEVKP